MRYECIMSHLYFSEACPINNNTNGNEFTDNPLLLPICPSRLRNHVQVIYPQGGVSGGFSSGCRGLFGSGFFLQDLVV